MGFWNSFFEIASEISDNLIEKAEKNREHRERVVKRAMNQTDEQLKETANSKSVWTDPVEKAAAKAILERRHPNQKGGK